MSRPRRFMRRREPGAVHERHLPYREICQRTDGTLAIEARRVLQDAALARLCGLRVIACAVLPVPRLLTVREGV